MHASEESWRADYLLRISARLRELVLYETITTPGTFRSLRDVGGLSSLLQDLIRWTLLLHRVQQLFEQVVPAALHDPCRIFVRETRLRHGMPKGSVHWPKTFARQASREQSSALEFVCHASERLITAPENVLLALTLEDVATGHGCVLRSLEEGQLLGSPGRRLLQRSRDVADRALNHRALRACRGEAQRVRQAGDAGWAALTAQVEQRTRQRPTAAPAWAKLLLDVRKDTRVLPTRLESKALERGALWQALAELEMLCAVRCVWPVRQRGAALNLFGHDARTLSRNGVEAHWSLSDNGVILAAITTAPETDATELRLAAYDRLLATSSARRWLVLHDIDADIASRSRAGLEVRFIRVSLESSAEHSISEVLADWLRAG